jgi:hypothetical protein
MHISPPMTDDQPLIRFFAHDKFPRLLDPAPAYDSWAFLEQPEPGRTVRMPQSTYGALWMARPHKFIDKEEGLFPALNLDDEAYCREMARLLNLGAEEAERRREAFFSRNPPALREGIRARTRLCGVSCWYQDSQESPKMWEEYAGSGTGVIVLTTLKQFNDALGFVSPQEGNRTARPAFSTINYVDRSSLFMAEDGYYHLLGIKSEEGYKHEREVHLIAKSPELVLATMNGECPSLTEIEHVASTAKDGFNLLIDLQHLVNEIRVHPSASDDYLEEIRRLAVSKHLPAHVVRRSDLSPAAPAKT